MRFLKENLKPKKSLGQNFLTNKKVVEDIIVAAELKPDDVVLEVGPGKGMLTEALLRTAKMVLAVEKDGELVEFLKKKFEKEIKEGKLNLIQGDILDMEVVVLNSKFKSQKAKLQFKIQNFKQDREGAENTIYNLQTERYKIVANIPYYITSHFLRKFLEADAQPSLMVLMIQKEVADRIAGDKKGKESLLSISVKAYGHPEKVCNVTAGNFNPAPKVDSAVLKISGISKDFFNGHYHAGWETIDEQKFFSLVKAGFSRKRKMLKNNLAGFLQRSPADITEVFKKCGIDEKARAENLSLEQWGCLYYVFFATEK